VPSSSKCALPNFPVEKFSLFKTSIKTKSIKLPKELSQVIVSIQKEMYKIVKSEDDLTAVQKRVLLDKMGQNIFEKQKKFLPELLATMKKARMCLQQIESKDDANACLSAVVEMKSKVTKDVDNSMDAWSPEKKEKILNHFEDYISFLESKMKCIRASQNISDLATCIKQEN
jgi:CRISPR/Cas system CSM-associated protein Csm2 small subunit